jgi:hypothetical protein
MLALIVAIFWLAILVPMAVLRFRNSRSDRSIDHFQAEHEVLSRQGYSVAPARRLDDAYLYEEHSYEPEHEPTRSRPRLTVVQDDDTYSTLESRTSWDEWERDYDYEDHRTLSIGADLSHNRYAAYASTPSPASYTNPRTYSSDFEPLDGYARAPMRPSMRVRRNRIFVSLGLSAVVTTALNFLIGLSLVQYLAVLSWVALVVYVAVAFFAVSQGYLEVSSLWGRRTTAYPVLEQGTTEPIDEDGYYEDGYYEVVPEDDQWGRESRRYALG